jgi:hypothetical protein
MSGYVNPFSFIDLNNKQAVTIVGKGAVLDANQKGQFFWVRSGSSLTLENITLQNGYYAHYANGGAFFVQGGSLTVKSGKFLNNTAQNHGELSTLTTGHRSRFFSPVIFRGNYAAYGNDVYAWTVGEPGDQNYLHRVRSQEVPDEQDLWW